MKKYLFFICVLVLLLLLPYSLKAGHFESSAKLFSSDALVFEVQISSDRFKADIKTAPAAHSFGPGSIENCDGL